MSERPLIWEGKDFCGGISKLATNFDNMLSSETFRTKAKDWYMHRLVDWDRDFEKSMHTVQVEREAVANGVLLTKEDDVTSNVLSPVPARFGREDEAM